MAQHFRAEFLQIPVVTRVYCTTCVLTTLAVVRAPRPIFEWALFRTTLAFFYYPWARTLTCHFSFPLSVPLATPGGDSNPTALSPRVCTTRRGKYARDNIWKPLAGLGIHTLPVYASLLLIVDIPRKTHHKTQQTCYWRACGSVFTLVS